MSICTHTHSHTHHYHTIYKKIEGKSNISTWHNNKHLLSTFPKFCTKISQTHDTLLSKSNKMHLPHSKCVSIPLWRLARVKQEVKAAICGFPYYNGGAPRPEGRINAHQPFSQRTHFSSRKPFQGRSYRNPFWLKNPLQGAGEEESQHRADKDSRLLL